MAYKQKGWSPFTLGIVTFSSRTTTKETSEEPKKSSRGIKDQVYGTVDPTSAFNKNGDDDTDKMTKKEQRKHRREVLKYNRKTAKPLTPAQKAKIRKQLENMDPNDPEAKLLRKMLNLKKNR